MKFLHDILFRVVKEDSEAYCALLLREASPQLSLDSSMDEHGNTLLHWAAGYGALKVAKKLIELGAAVNSKSHRGWSPVTEGLYWAQEMAERGNPDLCARCHRAVSIIRDHGGKGGLEDTSSSEYRRRERTAVPVFGQPPQQMPSQRKGKLTHAKPKEATELSTCFRANVSQDSQQQLVGKRTRAKPQQGTGPSTLQRAGVSHDRHRRKLFGAVRRDSLHQVQQMFVVIHQPHDLRDGNGNTLLHRAAEYGSVSVLEFLIRSGAHINATNERGWSPLTHALYWFDECRRRKGDANVRYANRCSHAVRILEQHGGQQLGEPETAASRQRRQEEELRAIHNELMSIPEELAPEDSVSNVQSLHASDYSELVLVNEPTDQRGNCFIGHTFLTTLREDWQDWSEWTLARDITEGMLVRSVHGQALRVIHVEKYDDDIQDLVHLDAEKGASLTVTASHRVKARRGGRDVTVRADELVHGDTLLCSTQGSCHTTLLRQIHKRRVLAEVVSISFSPDEPVASWCKPDTQIWSKGQKHTWTRRSRTNRSSPAIEFACTASEWGDMSEQWYGSIRD